MSRAWTRCLGGGDLPGLSRRGRLWLLSVVAVLVVAFVVGGLAVGRRVLASGRPVQPVLAGDVTMHLEPDARGTRATLTMDLTPVREGRSGPVRVTLATDDSTYVADDPPYSGRPVTVPAATGQTVVWEQVRGADCRQLEHQDGQGWRLGPPGADGCYRLTAWVPAAGDGRRVVGFVGLGPHVTVRRLTVTSPRGALTSCVLTYASAVRRAHRVTPCETGERVSPAVPSQVVGNREQGEQQVRFELGRVR